MGTIKKKIDFGNVKKIESHSAKIMLIKIAICFRVLKSFLSFIQFCPKLLDLLCLVHYSLFNQSQSSRERQVTHLPYSSCI